MNNGISKLYRDMGVDERGFGGGSQKEEIGKTFQLGIYYDHNAKPLTRENGIGSVMYKGDSAYVFAYEENAQLVYKEQGINLINFSNGVDFTQYLKNYFSEHKDQLNGLRKHDNRSHIKHINYIESLQLAQLVEGWNKNFNIPTLGYVREGKRVGIGKTISTRLPFTIGGKLVRMRYSPGVPVISFDTPNDRACPICLRDPSMN